MAAEMWDGAPDRLASCPQGAPNLLAEDHGSMRIGASEATRSCMAACVRSRSLSHVGTLGTACHAEGRGFESLHPL